MQYCEMLQIQTRNTSHRPLNSNIFVIVQQQEVSKTLEKHGMWRSVDNFGLRAANLKNLVATPEEDNLFIIFKTMECADWRWIKSGAGGFHLIDFF